MSANFGHLLNKTVALAGLGGYTVPGQHAVHPHRAEISGLYGGVK